MAGYDQLLERYHKASERFDYYITGLAVAVLAYSIQSFDSGKAVHYMWLVPVAWTSLLLAVIAGLVRIEWIVTILGIETEKFTIQTASQSLHQNISKIFSEVYDLKKISTGLPKEWEAKELEKGIDKTLSDYSESSNRLIKRQRNAVKIAEWAYRIREWCLVIGILFLGLSKIMNLYGLDK